jgi:hypothetical protein
VGDVITKKTCSRCGQPYDTEKVPCPDCMQRWGKRRPSIGLLSCPRDHCTAEERAVVETALADRRAEWQRQPNNADIDKLIATRRDFRLAVTALLAARKEST